MLITWKPLLKPSDGSAGGPGNFFETDPADPFLLLGIRAFLGSLLFLK